MSAFTIYSGDKGTLGADGLDGLGVGDVDSEAVNNPIDILLSANKSSNSAVMSMSRGGAASYVNRYGANDWQPSESVTNFIEYSNDFSQWSDPFSRWSLIGPTTDPFGGSDAAEINLDVATSELLGVGSVIEVPVSGISENTALTASFYIKVISGDVSSLDITLPPTGTRFVTLPATNDWVQIIYPTCAYSAPTSFAINPRGEAGARVAVYGAQLTNSNSYLQQIDTNGKPETVSFGRYQDRSNEKGMLIEGAKSNLVHNSNNLSVWTKSNCTISPLEAGDPFGNYSQNILIVYGSIPLAEIETTTDALTVGVEYNVSFYAYLTGGTMQSITVELGGGAASTTEIPSIEGFKRISAKCVAGSESTIKFKISSPSLSAKLALSCVQVETGNLSSYTSTCNIGATRVGDEISMPYSYNFPAPNLPFTLSFKASQLMDSAEKKYVFSNGLTTTDEFSLYYENEFLVMNNGGNLASVDMIQYNQVGLVYDGLSLKFYGERTLIDTVALASTNTIGSTVYIGYNGTGNHINAYLSNIMLYNVELSHNNMLYLQGL